LSNISINLHLNILYIKKKLFLNIKQKEMKKIATLLLLIITLSVHAQKMPSPPKEDAFGKESLWESFERKDAYDILNRTKKIAILPVSSAYFAKKIDPDSLQKYQVMLTKISSSVQKAYFEGLVKKTLSAVVQNPDETNRILSQKGLLNMELLNKTPKNTICFILGVDAVMFVDITMERLRSALGQLALNTLNPFNSTASDEIAIGLRLYEKANGDFFWANRSSVKITMLNNASDAFIKATGESFQSIPFVIK
jgi:hypothetical protein